jgi:hypothetical protein
LEPERARRALAETFRVLAGDPVAPRPLAVEVYGACEDWARHFLVAAPAPGPVTLDGTVTGRHPRAFAIR